MFIERALVRTTSTRTCVSLHLVHDWTRWTRVPAKDRTFDPRMCGTIEEVLGPLRGKRVDTLALACCDTGGAVVNHPAIGNLLGGARRVSLHGCTLARAMYPLCERVDTVQLVSAPGSGPLIRTTLGDLSDVFKRIRTLSLVGRVVGDIGADETCESLAMCLWLDRLELVDHGLNSMILVALCAGLERTTGVTVVAITDVWTSGAGARTIAETTPHDLIRFLFAFYSRGHSSRTERNATSAIR
jgi:hypothetical protein